MDAERYAAAQALLDAAHAFWKACQKEGQYGAVQWLQGTDGALVVFTRGEYKDRLMHNIDMLPSQLGKIHFFGETMPGIEDDSDPPNTTH